MPALGQPYRGAAVSRWDPETPGEVFEKFENLPLGTGLRHLTRSARVRQGYSGFVEESQIEGSEHQHYSDIHYQSFPNMIPKEKHIYTRDQGDQDHNVKHDRYVPGHFHPPIDSPATDP